MEVSITSMKAGRMTAKATIHGLTLGLHCSTCRLSSAKFNSQVSRCGDCRQKLQRNRVITHANGVITVKPVLFPLISRLFGLQAERSSRLKSLPLARVPL